MSLLGWRRLIFLAGTLPLSALMLYLDKLSGAEWSALVQWLGVAYLGSDAVAKLTRRQGGASGALPFPMFSRPSESTSPEPALVESKPAPAPPSSSDSTEVKV